MGIITTHSTFRFRFADIGRSTTNPLTFVAPNVITTSGSFAGSRLQVGQKLDVIGTASNDGRRGSISVFAGTQLDLDLEGGPALVAEGPITAELRGQFVDPGGFETWPVERVRMSDADHTVGVGFDDGFTGLSTPYDGTPLLVSCNGGAADQFKGTDQFEWYLSQRTDDPAKQYLAISREPDTASDSFSGSVRIVHTALATSEFGITASRPSPEQLANLFRYCALYVKRTIIPGIGPDVDQPIQWADVLAAQTTRTT